MFQRLRRMLISAWIREAAEARPAPAATRGTRAAFFATGLAAAGFVAASVQFGLDHGFHRMVPEAIESHNVSVATAITDRLLGHSSGYVAHQKVLDALRAGGMTSAPELLAPLGKTYPEVLLDGDQLNQAIRNALDVKLAGAPSLAEGTLAPMKAEDLGQADFYTLAFALFGFRIEAFFFAYFLLFGLSAACFWGAFSRFPILLWSAALACATHYLLMHYLVYSGDGLRDVVRLGTVHNRRFISALGILPTVYFVFLWLTRPPLTWTNGIASGAQAALLMFAVTMRASITYGVALIAGLAVAAMIARIARRRAGKPAPPPLGAFLSWPVAFVLLGFAALQIYRAAALNPVYATEDCIPHHLVWHSAYYGLPLHPRWASDFAAAHGNASGDQVSHNGAALHLKKTTGEDAATAFRSFCGLKWRPYERVLRAAYLSFVAEHPRYAVELYAYYKPKAFVELFGFFSGRTFASVGIWTWALGLSALAASFAVAFAGAPDPARQLSRAGLGFALVAAASFAPILFAYPDRRVMADQVWLLWTLIPLAALAAASALGRRLRAKPAAS